MWDITVQHIFMSMGERDHCCPLAREQAIGCHFVTTDSVGALPGHDKKRNEVS